MRIENKCIYISNYTSGCEAVITDDKNFCDKHRGDYEEMFKRRLNDCKHHLNEYVSYLSSCNESNLIPQCDSIFLFVSRNMWCMQNNKMNNKLEKLFRDHKCIKYYTSLCISANELYQRRKKAQVFIPYVTKHEFGFILHM